MFVRGHCLRPKSGGIVQPFLLPSSRLSIYSHCKFDDSITSAIHITPVLKSTIEMHPVYQEGSVYVAALTKLLLPSIPLVDN